MDNSLLLRTETSVVTTCPLYYMLDTVRTYAARELAALGERDDALEGLVRYCTDEASLAAEGLVRLGPDQWALAYAAGRTTSIDALLKDIERVVQRDGDCGGDIHFTVSRV